MCAGSHDIDSKERTLQKPPICISDGVWIAADAFIGPEVNIGEGAVVGAQAGVMKSVEPRTKIVGNPARIVGHLGQEIE